MKSPFRGRPRGPTRLILRSGAFRTPEGERSAAHRTSTACPVSGRPSRRPTAVRGPRRVDRRIRPRDAVERPGRRRPLLRPVGLQQPARRLERCVPRERALRPRGASAVAPARDRALALGHRRPLLLLRPLRPGRRTDPVPLRRLLPRVLSRGLRRACTPPPSSHGALPRQSVVRRRHRVSRGRCARGGGDLRRGDQHDRRQHGRRRDQPRLSARRPAPARTRRRDVRVDGLARRPHLGPRGRGLRRLRDHRQPLPLRDRGRHVRRGRDAGHRLAGGARPDRVLCLAADDEARGRTHRELAGADPADVLRGRRARAPRLRPLRPDQHRRVRARIGHDHRDHRARRSDLPRPRPAARNQPGGGPHRLA